MESGRRCFLCCLLCLFISIMASAVGNVEPPVFHMVNEPVFFVDTAAVFAQKVTGKRFRFPDLFHATIPFNIPDKLIDAL